MCIDIVKQVGQAIVTIATSRPKKIGGERAKYQIVFLKEGRFYVLYHQAR